MDPVSKNSALKCLNTDWSKFILHFESLAPEAKKKYLRQQGFANFPSLLAHISAWWEEAITNMQAVAENPDVQLQAYDVDRFNEEAVQAAGGKTGAEVVREFEVTRKRLVRAVSDVTEALVPNREIQIQLYWMIDNHFTEHRI
jgi:hypothetical protein